MLERFRSYFQESEHKNLDPEQKRRVSELEKALELRVGNPLLYLKALHHRSVLADENYTEDDSYERLEFLGDAVLDLIVSEIIFTRYPDKNEGFLTKLRAKLVRGEALAEYAEALDLSKFLIVGERARGQGIELSRSVLSDVFESLLGAIYVDAGYGKAYRFVEEVIGREVALDQITETLDNHKSMLLEWAQARQLSIPVYEVINEKGPGHDKTFVVKAVVDGRDCGTGTGKSKKQAEQRAARQALEALKEEG